MDERSDMDNAQESSEPQDEMADIGVLQQFASRIRRVEKQMQMLEKYPDPEVRKRHELGVTPIATQLRAEIYRETQKLDTKALQRKRLWELQDQLENLMKSIGWKPEFGDAPKEWTLGPDAKRIINPQFQERRSDGFRSDNRTDG